MWFLQNKLEAIHYLHFELLANLGKHFHKNIGDSKEHKNKQGILQLLPAASPSLVISNTINHS